MSGMGRKLIRAVIPLLMHLGISVFVTAVFVLLSRILKMPTADAALQTAVTALVSLPVFYRMWKKDRETVPAAVPKQTRSPWFFAGAFFGGAVLSFAGSLSFNWMGMTEHFSNQVQEELFASNLAVQVIGLCFLVPLAEELLYRGLFYERLREFLSLWPALLCAAVIFALSHGNMVQIVYALPMALILHWLYEKSGNLLAPVLFHMGANALSVLVEALG